VTFKLVATWVVPSLAQHRDRRIAAGRGDDCAAARFHQSGHSGLARRMIGPSPNADGQSAGT